MPREINENIEIACRSLPKECRDERWAYRLIESIVHLRRGIDIDTHWARFQRICNRKLGELHKLDERWLNSITDTYIDYGTLAERREAAIISGFYTHLTLMIFHHDVTGQHPIDKELFKKHKRSATDKLANYLKRADTCFELEPMTTIWFIIRRKLLDDKVKIHKQLRKKVGRNYLGR